MAEALSELATIVGRLQELLGADAVSTGEADLDFFSHDVYTRGAPLLAVIRPGDVEALGEAMRALHEAGIALIPRGGGMSYTNAYLAASPGAVVLDTGGLNRVVHVDTDDMYVTVECGCTWKTLAEALKAHGVRTPYWGPLSGMRATVGGALSQGSIFLGSGRHGSAADNVQSLDVLAADGSLIRTGSRVNTFAKPFYRNYGPDLTGLFTGDCGALGVKVRATLPLLRLLPESRYASFTYPSSATLLATMAEIARLRLVSECFAFDPGLQRQRLKRAGLTEDLKSLGRVVKSAGSTLGGIRESLKIAAAGRRFLDNEGFSMHVSLDAHTSSGADEALAAVREVAARDGREVENTIPKVMRADPFANVNSVLGPSGERWVPVHGIVPLSQGPAMFAELTAVFDEHEAELQRHGIETGVLMCTIGSSAVLLEPCLYWPDSRPPFQNRVLDGDYLKKLNSYDDNPAARPAVAALRSALTDTLHRNGATHFQIGKTYPYADDADPGARALLEAIKAHVDPHGCLNPGALGLAEPD
ncbi:MAG: FAD-binding oxidoreductase [Pseudomonadota bacterium]